MACCSLQLTCRYSACCPTEPYWWKINCRQPRYWLDQSQQKRRGCKNHPPFLTTTLRSLSVSVNVYLMLRSPLRKLSHLCSQENHQWEWPLWHKGNTQHWKFWCPLKLEDRIFWMIPKYKFLIHVQIKIFSSSLIKKCLKKNVDTATPCSLENYQLISFLPFSF